MTRPDDFVNRVVTADVMDALTDIPDDVIDCCVTSPPYWQLRDYQQDGQIGLEQSPEGYIAKMVEVFREVRRVLKDDGSAWVNLGDSYASGKGTCFNPGGGDSSAGAIEKRKTAGAYVLDRHNVSDVKKWGLKPKDLCMIPARVALALQADGWYLRSVIIWNKPNCMPESVTDRPTTSHEYIFLLSKSADYFYDADAIREPHKETSLERYEYGHNRKAPNDGFVSAGSTTGAFHSDRMGDFMNRFGRNKRTVWTINPAQTKFGHFATYPEELVEPCVFAGTSAKGNCARCGKPWVRITRKQSFVGSPRGSNPSLHRAIGHPQQGGISAISNTLGWRPDCFCESAPLCPVEPTRRPIVLDPFGGTGTTAAVAKRLGRYYVHIDLSEEYNAYARDRLRQKELF